MSERIDISTHQLAEMTAKSFNGKLSLEQVLSIWKEIGGSEALHIVCLKLMCFFYSFRPSCKVPAVAKKRRETH